MTPSSSQSLHTDQPAGQIKKLKPIGCISVHTQFNDVCTFQVMYIAICTRYISCTNLYVQVCTWYVHVYEIQNLFILVYTCTYTSDLCTYNWGCPADLITNQTVLDPKVHCHTSRAQQVGIEPTSPPTKVVWVKLPRQ